MQWLRLFLKIAILTDLELSGCTFVLSDFGVDVLKLVIATHHVSWNKVHWLRLLFYPVIFCQKIWSGNHSLSTIINNQCCKLWLDWKRGVQASWAFCPGWNVIQSLNRIREVPHFHAWKNCVEFSPSFLLFFAQLLDRGVAGKRKDAALLSCLSKICTHSNISICAEKF